MNICDFRLQDGIAPSFVQKPTIKPDADGKRLCFECKIKADPEPVITWYRDNSEIINKGILGILFVFCILIYTMFLFYLN